MEIGFEEKGHIYSINGEIASISVTELLTKHGLAPNYNGTSRAKLKESAEIGKAVHKDLENILNHIFGACHPDTTTSAAEPTFLIIISPVPNTDEAIAPE